MRKIKIADSTYDIDGRVQLLLSGFGQQDIVSIDAIIDAVKQVPARHLVGLKKINYDPSRLHQMLYYYLNIAPNLRSLGEFVQESRKINIYQFRDQQQFFRTLYHEIGHYVYFFIIDSILKKKWATQLHRSEDFVSDYAQKNAAEDFAECYSFYITQREKLSRLKKKYHFFRTDVFEKKEKETEKNRNGLDLLL